MKEEDLKSISNFIFETGILSKTPRSGLWFLGTGKQTVAEHLLRVAYIGYSLCHFNPEANKEKVVMMCLLHDLGEGRTSDLNYVHQKYGRLAESKAIDDISALVPFGESIKEYYEEYSKRETLESKIVKDADNLEWIATMREEETKGNIKAKSWADIAIKRLKTEAGQKLGKTLMETHPDSWWYNEDDSWFVDRGKE